MDLNEVLIILGTAAATAGLWLLHPAAALICLGVWLVLVGIRLPTIGLPSIRWPGRRPIPSPEEGGEKQ